MKLTEIMYFWKLQVCFLNFMYVRWLRYVCPCLGAEHLFKSYMKLPEIKHIMSIYLTVNIIIISFLFAKLLFKKVLYNDKKTGEITDKW